MLLILMILIRRQEMGNKFD